MPGKVPCRTSVGCPKGTPEKSKELTQENKRVYEHYLECKATGNFPDDPLVRRHASIIMQTEKEAEQAKQTQAIVSELISARPGK